MMTQQDDINGNVLLRENEHGIDIGPYPVHLTLFLNSSTMTHNPHSVLTQEEFWGEVLAKSRARGRVREDGWPLAGGFRFLPSPPGARQGGKIVSVPRTASRKGPPVHLHNIAGRSPFFSRGKATRKGPPIHQYPAPGSTPCQHLSENSSRVSLLQLSEEHDPVVISHCALYCWNEYLANGGEERREAFTRAAQWLLEGVRRIGGDAAGWPLVFAHPLYETRGSWLSSVAQGCGLSVLVRAYSLTGDQRFLETAQCVARTFERDILDGGVCAPVGADGVFLEEVAVYPAAHTLQGCIFGLLGLYDYLSITEAPRIAQFIERVETTLYMLFDEFDTGFWVCVDVLRRNLAAPAQLSQHIALVEALAGCSASSHFKERALRWRRYQHGNISLLRCALARRRMLLREALLRCVRGVLLAQPAGSVPSLAPRLRICVPVSDYPSPGGIKTFLDRTARVMADRWQMEYVTQYVRPDEEARVIHQFGRRWMAPWHFPQVWFYTLAGARKLLSLLREGAGYDLIIAQDGVFSGAFAALVGRLAGLRVVCIDHSTLTWYRSQAFRAERRRDVDARAWPWPLRLLVQCSRAFYWPSLRILARVATSQAAYLLSPGVYGDEVDDVCHELHIPASRGIRFNLPIDMQRQRVLSAGERAALRASMDIPADALVIAITVRLDLEKGLDISIESLSQALSALSPALRERVRVMIAGDGQVREWLEQEIRQRGLSQTCRMMGHISNEEVQSLLAVSDIALHTSTRCACMPTAVLEGMAAGCAVIASNVPLATVRLLDGERGIVVPAGDVAQTARALERVLQDRELRIRMGHAARTYIALHHSPEALRRVLLRASYWSDLASLLEFQAEPPEVAERAEREHEFPGEQDNRVFYGQ